uniref:Uncharacterized protein n=2 Tax=viral metagenome TaxID=1070528 RepID=A0A6M3JW78_9ZZZZ
MCGAECALDRMVPSLYEWACDYLHLRPLATATVSGPGDYSTDRVDTYPMAGVQDRVG